jgi:dTDP-glucose pyrophosphorylase
MWGIIPAAGTGSRIQPLAFSKELLPVGSRVENGQERPRAVSEYLVERMIRAGAERLCFVISPGKTDILEYYGSRLWGVDITYVVQPSPGGLCDAVFRALWLVNQEEQVLIGLPDTVWEPEDGFSTLPDDVLSFLLFPVKHPELFDAVLTDSNGAVEEIQVKQKDARSHWIWGGVRMPGSVLRDLHTIWCRPERKDEYLGTLVNAWLREGGRAVGVRSGRAYVDVGTVHGYRTALRLLETGSREDDEVAGMAGSMGLYELEREVKNGRNAALAVEQ